MDQVPYQLIVMILFIALIVGMVINMTLHTPSFSPSDEGFYGGVSDIPDCLRTLPEASQLLEKVSHVSRYPSDGAADYQEFVLILSKLACLKKDLTSANGTVDATRHQAYETAHDRVSVGELCGMCLSQTVGARDLDISFATWRDRAMVLLRKLCVEANLSEIEFNNAEILFKKLYDDVYHVATSRCLKPHESQNQGDVSGYLSEHLKNRRDYEYKYGESSASGWNGAV